MRTIDIRSHDSFNYPINHCDSDKNQSLWLGDEKEIYLFFNMPYWLTDRDLLKARLILFKLPYNASDCGKAACGKNANDQYAIGPLLEVFNAIYYTDKPPALDFSRCVSFKNPCCRTYTEIDITHIVRDWSNNQLENNGLFLMSKKNSSYILYASGQHTIPGMHPMIRLSCKNTEHFHTWHSVPCEVVVT